MYTYVRSTKLSDIRRRSDYITNKTGKHAAEDMMCVGGSTSDWLPYARFEKQHRRSSEQNNEGRELIVALPNAWGSLLAKPFLNSRVDNLARKLIGKDTDYQFAVHWNKGHTNLHAHIIFSERTVSLENAAKWDRDIYLTADGKVARRKADRAVDGNGNIKPPIHRKGDPKVSDVNFTAKDKKYKSKNWLQGVKQLVDRTFSLEADKKHITNYLHTYHEGKAPQAAERVRELNAIIREANRMLDDLKKEGYKLKKAGDGVYHEFFKRIMGKIQDGQSIDDWFLNNIALNADKVQRKQDSKAQKEQKAEQKKAAREQKQLELQREQTETAIKYLTEMVSDNIRSRVEREGGVYEHIEAHLTELGVHSSRLDSRTREKYEKYINKYLSYEEQQAHKADIIRTIANRSKPDSLYQRGTAKVLNEYIKSNNLNVAPISELNQVAQERQRREQEIARQRKKSGSSLNDLILYAEKKAQEEKENPQYNSQDIPSKGKSR